MQLQAGWGTLLISLIATEISSCILIWYFGLDHDERDIITHKILSK